MFREQACAGAEEGASLDGIGDAVGRGEFAGEIDRDLSHLRQPAVEAG
jgi:hypothetical protein